MGETSCTATSTVVSFKKAGLIWALSSGWRADGAALCVAEGVRGLEVLGSILAFESNGLFIGRLSERAREKASGASGLLLLLLLASRNAPVAVVIRRERRHGLLGTHVTAHASAHTETTKVSTVTHKLVLISELICVFPAAGERSMADCKRVWLITDGGFSGSVFAGVEAAR